MQEVSESESERKIDDNKRTGMKEIDDDWHCPWSLKIVVVRKVGSH